MRNLLLTAFMLVSIVANASKAMTLPCPFVQPDGTQLQVMCFGDEYFNYRTTTDGTLLVCEGKAFYVAEVLADGSIKSSGMLAHEPQQRSFAEQRMADAQNRTLFFSSAEKRVSHARYAFGNITPPSGIPPYVPHTGTVRIPVIFVEFPDEKFQEGNIDVLKQNLMDEEYTPKTSEMSFNKTKYSSVKNYYADSSNGKFDLQFDFYGPYTTPQNKLYYGYQNGSSHTGPRLMSDVLPQADEAIDFSLYDNDGDGFADICVYICAGQQAQAPTGDHTSDIWSACGFVSATDAYHSSDGVSIRRYFYDSELLTKKYPGKNVPYHAGIGVFCHEFGHALGLPDLYYNADWAKINNGPEQWDLMDDGENIRNGYWPIPYTIWERMDFGWIEPIVLDEPQDVTVWPLDDTEGRGKAYVIRNPENQDEFWTIENIPSAGWYAGVYGKGTGIVIQHINYSDAMFLNTFPNRIQGKPNCTLMPADGQLGIETIKDEPDSEYNARKKEQLYGDPYPGSTGKTSLEAYKNYAGEEDMVNAFPITDIVLNDDGSVSFKFMGGTPTGITQHESVSDVTSGAYNLSGQFVGRNANGHGIFIVDGKKVVR